MSSRAATIADGVKAIINAATLSQAVTAVREYVPLEQVAALGTLVVSVVPKKATRDPRFRGHAFNDVKVDIAVAKKVADKTNATIDPLMQLAKEIADRFGPGAYVNNAKWSATEHEPLYDPDVLNESFVFISLITVTFKV